MTTFVVYDTGALLAAERNDRHFQLAHRRFLDHGRQLIIPSPVLTQAWRGGARQALLSRVLRSCEVEPVDQELAREAGVLLGLSKCTDTVDAIVVATALRSGALIVTSDPDDLSMLWRSAETGTPPRLLPI